MVCVVHKFNIIEGKEWDAVVEASKKMFKYEKQEFGQEMIFMKAVTGDTGRIMTIGFFESQQAHDEYVKKERKDPLFRELFEAAQIPQSVLRISPETDFFDVID